MNKVMEVGKCLLNQVSNRKAPKGLFLHIQKTAGTSIVHIAQSYYRYSMTSHGGHVGKSPDDFIGTKFVSGHFGYDFARELMADRYSFTFLRDPKERVLSMYYFLRGQKENLFPMYKLAKELELEEFLEAGFSNPMVKQRIWNNQTWQLAYGWANCANKTVEAFESKEMLELANLHLHYFNHVGFTETFEKDRDIILKGLELPIPDDKVITNVSSRRSESELSSKAQTLLEELTKLDQALYESAWLKYGST